MELIHLEKREGAYQAFFREYLVASICHSGTLAAGHYTAHILHKQDSQWLLCNDKAVLPIQSSEIDNKHSYVLFYELS